MEITVKNLTKSFKGIKILDNVNITFKSKKNNSISWKKW